jgi:hypothetical protein
MNELLEGGDCQAARAYAPQGKLRLIFRAVVAGACLFGGASASQAVLIDTFASAYSTASPLSATVASLLWKNGGPITNVPAGSFFNSIPNNLTLDVSTFNVGLNTPGVVHLNTPGYGTDTFVVTSADSLNTAVFHVSNAKLVQNEITLPVVGQFGLGYIVADLVLDTSLSQTTAAFQAELFPGFASGGKVIMTFNGVRVQSNGTAIVSASPSASFTVTAVPEPSCLVMTASGFAALLGWRWRRKNQFAAREFASDTFDSNIQK